MAKPKYMERRRNIWYARLGIPEAVRHHFDGRIRFFQSTKHSDQDKAQIRALELVAQWKRQIAAAKNIKFDSDVELALDLRKQIESERKEFDPVQQGDYPPIEDAVSDHIDTLREKGEGERAAKIASIIYQNQVVLQAELPGWEATVKGTPRSISQKIKAGREVAERFPTLTDITSQSVKDWARYLMAPKSEGGREFAKPTIERRFNAGRSIWRYLQDHDKAPSDIQPFTLPSFVSEAEKAKRRQRQRETGSPKARVGFKPADLVRLRGIAAKTKYKPEQLVALVTLGMYTGARIEELCSLKCSECSERALTITKSKTEAGYREVPVHPEIAPFVRELLSNSKDGYLISGLNITSSTGERSSAIGKRFGRLKKKEGFSKSTGFHSIRHTVITMLENAGVGENTTADIVGQDKPRITYGLYSGGSSYETKLEAIKLLKYPEPE